jgi:hypothetical protein
MRAQGRSGKPRARVAAYSFPPIGGGGVARTLVDPESPQSLIRCLENLRRWALDGEPFPGPDAQVRASLCAATTMLCLVPTLERLARVGVTR